MQKKRSIETMVVGGLLRAMYEESQQILVMASYSALAMLTTSPDLLFGKIPIFVNGFLFAFAQRRRPGIRSAWLE